MNEEDDIGIVTFFSSRHYWTFFSAGFFGCCKCCKDKFSGMTAEINPIDQIMTGAMFCAQIAIRIDVGELNRPDCPECKQGVKLTMLYYAVSFGCVLILVWAMLSFILLLLTALMTCTVLTCLRENREMTAEIKDTYIRLGFLPFGVCRKSLLEREIT